MLDADERITPELQKEIQNVLAEDNKNTVYALPRLSWCFGKFIRHSGWYPDYVTRLYAKEKAQYNSQLVHEKLEYTSKMKLVKLRVTYFIILIVILNTTWLNLRVMQLHGQTRSRQG